MTAPLTPSPGIGMALALAGWLLCGLAGGTAHFALLRWNAALYLAGTGMLRPLGVQALRLAATTALLTFAAWHGALPLLVAAIGVLLARLLMLRTARSVR